MNYYTTKLDVSITSKSWRLSPILAGEFYLLSWYAYVIIYMYWHIYLEREIFREDVTLEISF